MQPKMQPNIQDAASVAGVERFDPSEYGMHHVDRKLGDNQSSRPISRCWSRDFRAQGGSGIRGPRPLSNISRLCSLE